MKDDSLKVTEFINKNDWSKFVSNRPHGNIYQTPEMAEVYKRTENYEPISLAVVDEKTDEILAILLAVVIREMRGILGSFSARSVIEGGPSFVEGEEGLNAVSLLMEEYNKIAKRKCALYSEIRNTYDTSHFHPLFEELGYNFEDHLNFLIDLNKPEEEIWKQIHSSMRKNIKRAQRNGVIIEEMEDKSYIETFYDFLKDVYHDTKVPLMDISLFEAIYDILVPKGMAKFYLAKHNGEYIGGRSTLFYKKIVYAHRVGVPRKYKILYSNALLNYQIMLWGSENGYHTFDFGGAGKPDKEYGVREFKRQFGGKSVNFGRYKKTHSPLRMKIAEKGFEVYRRIFM
jgi:serine/alanine adding enzyme